MIFRYLPQISLAAASFVGYTATIHKHVFGAEDYKKKLMYYKDEEQPFDPNTKKIIEEMIDFSLLNMPAVDVVRMNFYWSSQLDPSHHGTHLARFGTFIGVPITFRYGSKSDVDLFYLENCGLSLTNDNTAAIDSLKDALVLSENAKRFAIVTELKAMDTFYVVEKLNMFGCLMGYYCMGSVFSPFTEKLPGSVQLLSLIAVACLWIYLWYNIERFYTFRRTTNADKAATELGQEYLVGGLEYFAKLRQRNMMLRTLQIDGDKLYKENGDRITPVFEVPKASLSLREKRLLWLKNEAMKHGLDNISSANLQSEQNTQEDKRTTNNIKQDITYQTDTSNIPAEEKNNDPGFWRKAIGTVMELIIP